MKWKQNSKEVAAFGQERDGVIIEIAIIAVFSPKQISAAVVSAGNPNRTKDEKDIFMNASQLLHALNMQRHQRHKPTDQGGVMTAHARWRSYIQIYMAKHSSWIWCPLQSNPHLCAFPGDPKKYLVSINQLQRLPNDRSRL